MINRINEGSVGDNFMELELCLQLLMQGLPLLAQIFNAFQEEKITILKHEQTKELHQLKFNLDSPDVALEFAQNQTPTHQPSISQVPIVNSPYFSTENWPLLVLPSQVITSGTAKNSFVQRPLRVFLFPLKLQGNCDPKLIEHRVDIELNLTQGIREFVEKYYPLNSQSRPIEFIAGAWKEQNFNQEATIKSLFEALRSEPTLILESEIVRDSLNFRIAYWGMGQDNYYYKTILSQINYQTIIYESAKIRALKWKETAEKLLELGESLEVIQQLGQENVTNLELLEKEEKWKQCGINTDELNLPYQITTKDFVAFSKFLITYHCVITSCIADICNLIYRESTPILPELIFHLATDLSVQQQGNLLDSILGYYQDILKILEVRHPQKVTEMSLKLTESLALLPNKDWAKKQLDYSLQLWLNQKQIKSINTVETLATVYPFITEQDQVVIDHLKQCLMALEDEIYLKSLSHLFNQPESLKLINSTKKNLIDINQNVDALAKNSGVVVNLTPAFKQDKFSIQHTLPGHSGKASSIVVSPDGTTLASGSEDNTIKLWRLDNGELIQTLNGNFGRVLAITLSPNGQTLASSHRKTDHSCIKIWQPETGELIHTLVGHHKWIYALAVTPDGETLVSGGYKIKTWNLKTGEAKQTLAGHKKWVYSLAISPDGKTLVSSGGDKTIKIWNLYNGELIQTLEGHLDWIRSVAMSPNGEILASGSDDNTIRIWDIKKGKLIRVLSGHSDWVLSLAMSPDGEILMSGSKDNTIKIWHWETGKLLGTLTGHKKWVYSLAMSPDGETLASGSEDKTIKIWRTGL